MLKRFRVNLFRYGKSRWAGRILLWSSVIIFFASLLLFYNLGFGNQNGGSGTMGSKLLSFLSLLLTVPAIIIVNYIAALLYALARTVARR